jgi:hypothetical protein
MCGESVGQLVNTAKNNCVLCCKIIIGGINPKNKQAP